MKNKLVSTLEVILIVLCIIASVHLMKWFDSAWEDLDIKVRIVQAAQVAEKKPLSANEIYKLNEKSVGKLLHSVVTVNARTREVREETLGGGSAFFSEEFPPTITTCYHVTRSPGLFLFSVDAAGNPCFLIIIESKFTLVMKDNRRYKAKVISTDPGLDTAFLSVPDIDKKDFNVVKLGDSSKLKKGDIVYALGSPHLMGDSLTEGPISNEHRKIGMNYIEDLVQTQCQINPGSSGCPIFNVYGEVVGIADIIIPGSGIGFFIPINLVRFDKERIGRWVYPEIGFEALKDNFPRDTSKNVDMTVEAKYLKRTLIEEGMTAKSKIKLHNLKAIAMGTTEKYAIIYLIKAENSPFKVGDIVTAIDGHPMVGGMDIRIYIRDKKVGDIVKVDLLRARNGVLLTYSIEYVLE